MALDPVDNVWAVPLLLGASLLPLVSIPAFYEKAFDSLSFLSVTADQGAIEALVPASASGYEPPPDIGKPRRTGGSGGRVAPS